VVKERSARWLQILFEDLISSSPYILAIIELDSIQRFNNYQYPILNRITGLASGGTGGGSPPPPPPPPPPPGGSGGSGSGAGTFSVELPTVLIDTGQEEADSPDAIFTYSSPPASYLASFALSIGQSYSSGADVEVYLNDVKIMTFNWNAFDTSTQSQTVNVKGILIAGDNAFHLHYHIAYPALSPQAAVPSNGSLTVTALSSKTYNTQVLMQKNFDDGKGCSQAYQAGIEIDVVTLDQNHYIVAKATTDASGVAVFDMTMGNSVPGGTWQFYDHLTGALSPTFAVPGSGTERHRWCIFQDAGVTDYFN
jgi:hypothetical protein